MSKTFGIGTLKPYFQFSAEEGWCDLTGGKRSPVYQALPAFVFDSIFEGTGHVVVVVSLLLSGIENQVDKLGKSWYSCRFASDISEENARRVQARKCLEYNLQGVSGRISETVWDFTFALSRKSLSDFLYAYLFIAVSFFCSGQISTWYSLYLAVKNICVPRA